MENFLTGVPGVEFRVVTEYVGETVSELKKNDIMEMFGQSAYELDRIEGCKIQERTRVHGADGSDGGKRPRTS